MYVENFRNLMVQELSLAMLASPVKPKRRSTKSLNLFMPIFGTNKKTFTTS